MSGKQRNLVLGTCVLLIAVSGCKGYLDLDPSSDNSFPEAEAGVSIPTECLQCKEKNVGMTKDQAFDLQADENEFVVTDDEGALVISKKKSRDSKFLWVADTELSGVVKIDLETFKIVGRYRTGGSDTSRTTVNVLGEAFIGSRGGGGGWQAGDMGDSWGEGGGVTKILPYGQDCPDTNNDGVITTSTGPDDVLAYGQDDCVAWHTETEGDIRGLAAQDISGMKPTGMCQGFNSGQKEFNEQPVSIADEHYVWVGGMHGKIYKLDAETGEILLKITAPSSVYGMALSGDGKLWTVNELAFVDTLKCTDQASCEAAPTCTQECTETSCSDKCDDAVKARIQGISGYGITVDYKQRVWTSAQTTRYDPHAPVNTRRKEGPPSGSGGIAADADGWIWACGGYGAGTEGGYGAGTVRINAETMESVNISAPNKGLAIDTKGRVLTIEGTGVHLIEPGNKNTLSDYTLTKNIVQLKGYAYAYSDMTGVQTRLAANDPGQYRHRFEGCDGTTTTWRQLKWDVEVPEGTWVIFNVRSADTVDQLKTAPWYSVVCLTSADDLNIADLENHEGNYLEVDVRFSATEDSSSFKSARIKSFGVKYECTNAIE